MKSEPVTKHRSLTGGRILSASLYFTAMLIFISFLDISLPKNLVPVCMLRSVTGLYCPGCGGTRAMRMILKGRPLLSVLYHPAVLYMAYLLWVYILSFLLSRLSRGKLAFIGPRPWHFYVLIALILLSFAVKNIMLIGFGVTVENLVELLS